MIDNLSTLLIEFFYFLYYNIGVNLINWSEDGQFIVIHNLIELTKHVLPKFFNTTGLRFLISFAFF